MLDKLFDVGDNKVREHCHLTEKYRGSHHWSCNINLRLILLIFQPHSGFKWLNRGEIDRFDVTSTDENSSGGYILEVDLEYPDKLHKLHIA